MSLLDHVNDAVKSVKSYIPGKPIEDLAREYNLDPANIIKLASNESPLGVSPLALEAIKKAASEMYIYPDGAAYKLKNKLSQKYNIDTEQLIIGDGAEELIRFISHCFLSPEKSVVMSMHTFPLYKIAASMFGAEIIEVPMQNYTFDLKTMLQNIKTNTRVIYICNPNNPTGSMVKNEDIEYFMENIPEDVLVVFDEAYGDIAQKEMPDTLKYVKNNRNVLILKSFSKAYGLAGLRVGYGISSPEIVQALNKTRMVFNCNRMAQIAAAAALDDSQYVENSKTVYKKGIKQLINSCKKLNLQYVQPFANFILINVGDGQKIFNELLKMGIIVRPQSECQLPEWIRVTIGTEEQNNKFIKAIEKVLS